MEIPFLTCKRALKCRAGVGTNHFVNYVVIYSFLVITWYLKRFKLL